MSCWRRPSSLSPGDLPTQLSPGPARLPHHEASPALPQRQEDPVALSRGGADCSAGTVSRQPSESARRKCQRPCLLGLVTPLSESLAHRRRSTETRWLTSVELRRALGISRKQQQTQALSPGFYPSASQPCRTPLPSLETFALWHSAQQLHCACLSSLPAASSGPREATSRAPGLQRPPALSSEPGSPDHPLWAPVECFCRPCPADH